jgi:CBS domain-containing protein
MELSDQVRCVLARKAPGLWSISPEATVFEAVQLMADRDIGALPVVRSGQILGIFSERDYARKIILQGKSSKQTLVSEVMTQSPVCVTPRETVDECMRLMTHQRTRHILVVEHGGVSGVVSIGDLVNWIISTQAETIGHLNSYIASAYPG